VSAFLDTNILVYAQQTGRKAEISQNLLDNGGTISALVLNELVNVLRKKEGRNFAEIAAVLDDIENALDPARPLTAQNCRSALTLAGEHGFSFYDALIVASAIEAGCDTLYSEDMQHGRTIGKLTIRNPFVKEVR
jgi:predicted nucleic acid-binding protein